MSPTEWSSIKTSRDSGIQNKSEIIELLSNEGIENLTKSRFAAMIVAMNRPELDDLTKWAFYPGMGFNEMGKWWGDLGQRDFPHEGIDLCLYEDISGSIAHLPVHTRIPAMHDGVVRALYKDFLGIAIVMEHISPEGAPSGLLSMYAHTAPLEKIAVGRRIHTGDAIATIADTSHTRSRILHHLHFSIARMISPLDFDRFEWNMVRDPSKITLLDPVPLLDVPCRVLDKNLFDPPKVTVD